MLVKSQALPCILYLLYLQCTAGMGNSLSHPSADITHYILCAVQYQHPMANGFCLTFLHGCAAQKPSTEKMRTKAPVPLKTDVPTMGLHSNKNFVTTNAIQAILSKPKQMPEDFRYCINSFPSLPLVCFPHRVRVEYVFRGLLPCTA